MKKDNEDLDNEFQFEEINEEEEKKKAAKKEAMSWVKSFAAVIIFTFVFLQIFTNANIPSSSMENTIMTNDRVFGYNFAYKSKDPKRDDIIIFHMPDSPKEIYIKRVIGLPGDVVNFVEDDSGEEPCIKVAINGKILDEPYIKEPMELNDDVDLEFHVPEDSYFVMGDNRNDSYDGRYWENNFVNKKLIISKAVFRYWPFNRMGTLD